jgi:hypothetical protein
MKGDTELRWKSKGNCMQKVYGVFDGTEVYGEKELSCTKIRLNRYRMNIK